MTSDRTEVRSGCSTKCVRHEIPAKAQTDRIDTVRHPMGYVRGDIDAKSFEFAFCHMQRRDGYNRIGRSMHKSTGGFAKSECASPAVPASMPE